MVAWCKNHLSHMVPTAVKKRYTAVNVKRYVHYIFAAVSPNLCMQNATL